jgi:glycosyltransferase involved in cell wall biosynthesis
MNDFFNQVLLISPEAWNAHTVSKHHYAVTLARKGSRVFFLDPPEDKLSQIDVEKTDCENLWRVRSPKVAPGLRFYPRQLRRYLEKRWLENLERKIGGRFTAIWLFENSRFYDMNFAGDRLKIYHQVDLTQNYHVDEASRSADVCFAVNEQIYNLLKPHTNHLFKIPHGVAISINPTELNRKEKKRFEKKNLHAIYIGNLEIPYLDIELLEKLIASHSELSFHLVGGYDENGKLYRQLSKYENIFWWGKVSKEKIPTLLAHADIAILLYRARNEFERRQLTSSHKIMEYLASGKTIVATWTEEYADKRELFPMERTHAEYLERFADVVKRIEWYNSEENRAKRIAFAEEHSYDRQLFRIIQIVENLFDENGKMSVAVEKMPQT